MKEIFKLTFKAQFAEKGLPLGAASLSLRMLEWRIANQIVVIATELGHIVLFPCYFCQEAISTTSLRCH